MSAVTTSASSPGLLVIICGLPGSGKTTEARRLAEQLRGVRLGPDEWMTALGVNLWDSDMRVRVENLQWTVAEDLLLAGNTVIIEWGTWARSERDTLLRRARELGAGARLVHLDAPDEELWRRIQARAREDPPIRRADIEVWRRQFEVPDEQELSRYDSHRSVDGR